MKKLFFGALCIGATMMLNSCYVQEINVGMDEFAPATKVAKVKNQQFIYGLVEKTQDKAENHVKDTKHFRVRTMQTFWDGFLAGITWGIYTPSTTYYYEPAK
jgi:hypothetical protein